MPRFTRFTLDPSTEPDRRLNCALANGDLTGVGETGFEGYHVGARTHPYAYYGGKCYFEVARAIGCGHLAVGLVVDDVRFNTYSDHATILSSSLSIFYHTTGEVYWRGVLQPYTVDPVAEGETVGIYFDLETGTMGFTTTTGGDHGAFEVVEYLPYTNDFPTQPMILWGSAMTGMHAMILGAADTGHVEFTANFGQNAWETTPPDSYYARGFGRYGIEEWEPTAESVIEAHLNTGVAMRASPSSESVLRADLYVPRLLAASMEAAPLFTAALANRLRFQLDVTSGATVAGVMPVWYTQTIAKVLSVQYDIKAPIRTSFGFASHIGRQDTRVQAATQFTFNTTPVRGVFAINCTDRVQNSVGLTSVLGSRVRSSFGVSYLSKAQSLLSVSYGPRVQGVMQASSNLVGRLSFGLGIFYAPRALNALSVVSAGRVINSVGLASALGNRVRASFAASYHLSRVTAEVAFAHHLCHRAIAVAKVSSALVARVKTSVGVKYAIRDIDRVLAGLNFGYSLMSVGSISQAQAPFMHINGKSVWLSSADVACDEGGYFWEGTFTLLNPGDSQHINYNDEFVVDLAGDQYAFLVDSRTVSRTADPPECVVNVYGRSPLVKYTSPRAPLVSKTWESDTPASSIAEELVPGVVWGVLDWNIPASIFGVEKVPPLEALVKLASAAGGVVESLPNGLVIVRYQHPTPVAEYSDATTQLSISDIEDNYTYSERYVAVSTVDLLTIGDYSPASAKDRVEVEFPESPDEAKVSVYPNVWRDSITAYPTGDVQILSYVGVEEREEIELIEFVAGVASVRFPVVAITAVSWKTNPLGNVNHGEYNTAVTCSVGSIGYSMAQITYTTKAHVFRVVGDLGTTVQLVFEE